MLYTNEMHWNQLQCTLPQRALHWISMHFIGVKQLLGNLMGYSAQYISEDFNEQCVTMSCRRVLYIAGVALGTLQCTSAVGGTQGYTAIHWGPPGYTKVHWGCTGVHQGVHQEIDSNLSPHQKSTTLHFALYLLCKLLPANSCRLWEDKENLDATLHWLRAIWSNFFEVFTPKFKN